MEDDLTEAVYCEMLAKSEARALVTLILRWPHLRRSGDRGVWVGKYYCALDYDTSSGIVSVIISKMVDGIVHVCHHSFYSEEFLSKNFNPSEVVNEQT